MSIKPLHDRVLIKRLEDAGEEIRGGIVIPDTAKEKPQEGEVVAVGEGKVLESGETVKMSVKAGDRILFGKYSGTEVKIDDEEYLIMREDEILGILVGKKSKVKA
ncbi:MAG: co-chaperone GroES [Acidobacteria bacterium]|nr:co-chaperone GroES [Acidobacteriota bacterium]TDI13752.1 MAG: co-chaperone GroES [Acidobacteriota bacterium]